MTTPRILPALLLLATPAFAGADDLGDVRLNQVQVIGSHNSYHVEPPAGVLAVIARANPRGAESLQYSHPPLAEQFEARKIRQIELDVFADPDGGLYADPAIRKLAALTGKDLGPEPDLDGRLRKPGMKVLHVAGVDYQSTAPTFVDALSQVRSWSRLNPKHVPILILVELKTAEEVRIGGKFIPFDAARLAELEAEIHSVFPRPEILAPDDVRGDSKSLPDAIRARGWPKLDAVRGRVMFALDNTGAERDTYLKGHPALAGRLMFASVDEGDPAAAWFKINEPIGRFDDIQRLVKAGFLVRTRADADTRQARDGSTAMRDRALASGAQFVSTDYPTPDPRFTEYRVELPGGVVARSNPVSGDRAWDGVDLERGR
ncbi:phosphatidylinositol-specific phospholipase C1-like protein [Paludisphaera mucosa]|uniref:Phosphatidylinositol-specific phospholipase C1-like protein n=1 Tax=Paludisphaera mucosa TaxID=3030827 RepID=A0ABT6FH70_9BACT|nr:phosphatidylinositol-specific phospholipase C1-like protein [Paludisphaera mucosa]MDG3006874.1 phosphatidylinositol-specific phospholipase C1-like protein [Paludisphaera mucosa]